MIWLTEYYHLIDCKAYGLFQYYSLWGNGKSCHLYIFETLTDDFWSVIFFFSGFTLIYTLSETLIVCRAIQFRMFWVETLLNKAFTLNQIKL